MSFTITVDCQDYVLSYTSGKKIYIPVTNALTALETNQKVKIGDTSVDHTKCTSPDGSSLSASAFVDAVRTLRGNPGSNPSSAAVALNGSVANWTHMVADGDYSNVSIVNKFGSNPDIDTGTVPENLFGGSGLYTWLSTAKSLRIAAGGVAADTAAGAGAQQLTILGLDGDFNAIEETIDFNGTSASTATTQTFLRVNRAFVSRTGTYHWIQDSANPITLETTDSETLAVITDGQTKNAIYTVPAGFFAIVTSIRVSMRTSGGSASAAATLDWISYENGDDITTSPYEATRTRYTMNVGANADSSVTDDFRLKLPAKTDFYARVTTVTDNNTTISAAFTVYLYQENS